MRTFLPAAALTLLASNTHAIEIGTSPPPTLKYSDFVFDGKTTYCYTVTQGAAAAMYEYTTLGLEGKGDECPRQLSLEQTTTGEISANQPVAYKLTATSIQISRANVHACSSSLTCDAFRKGNNSRVSEEESATFTASKATFPSTLNFTSPDKYTVFAVVIVPGQSSDGATMRFVAYTSTTVGSNGPKNTTTSEQEKEPDAAATVLAPSSNAPNATKTPVPSSSPPKSAAAATKFVASVAAGVTVAASLLLMAF